MIAVDLARLGSGIGHELLRNVGVIAGGEGRAACRRAHLGNGALRRRTSFYERAKCVPSCNREGLVVCPNAVLIARCSLT